VLYNTVRKAAVKAYAGFVPRPRLHDDALRQRLLEVASQVISADGEGAVTVRGVAAKCGTSASAVYALFGSREALVAAVSEEGFRRFGTRLHAVPRTEDPAADLAALGLAYRESALADPHFYRVMFDRGVAPHDGRAGTGHPTFHVLRDAVARLFAAADPAASLERAVEGALALWALAHGLVGLELAGLVPGSEAERADRYRAALLAAGPALLQPVR
jgi:AcrR family transcriptional regulator